MAFLNPIDTQSVIDIGNICTFLSGDDIRKQSVFGNPYFDETLPIDISIVTDVLTFAYVSNPYNPDVNSIANYLLSLCGKYIPAAQRLLGQKTGVVVSTGGNNVNQLTTIVNIPQIIVGKAGSLLQDGDTEFTILNVDAAPEGVIQAWADIEGLLVDDADATITDQTTILAEWLAGIGYKFTLQNGATFKTGQVVKGQFPKVVNLTTGTSGGGSAQDLNFYCTLNGNETKSFLNTNGQIFLVGTNTLNFINITIFCKSATNETLIITWVGKVYNIGNVVTVDPFAQKQNIGINPFEDTTFFDDVIVAADNSFIGVRITATGITDKIINCRAVFSITSYSL